MTQPQSMEFLGAYVTKVEVSMGWGSESGFCNLELVEEPKDGKIFTPPVLGAGCIFKFGKLEFGGIFKRYTYSEDNSSGRRYQVVLESPNTILSGAYLILNNFQGTVYTDDSNIDRLSLKPVMTYGGQYPTNIINLYANKENYEYGGLFGKAELNSMGYPIKNIVSDISSTIAKGVFGGKLKFSSTEYDIDLSELTEVIKNIDQYRINSWQVDLLSMISDICDMGAYDFTTTLTGTTNSLGVITSNAKIKVKVLSRKSPPNPNVISQTIQQLKNKPDKQKNLISYNTGKEYADIVTQKVLVGGPASRYWLADRRHIIPIWGQLGVGQGAVYFYGSSIYEYANMFAPIRVTIDGGYDNNFTYVDTNLLELRCALNGNRDAWTAYHILIALKEGRKGFTFGNFAITESSFADLLQGKLGPEDLMNTDVEDAEYYASWMYGQAEAQKTYAQRLINARFDCIKKAAEAFYGTSFLVSIPGEVGGKDNSFRWIELDQKYENAWEIAASAWAGDNNSYDFPDIKFYDEAGRFQAVAVYPNYPNMDFSMLGSDYGRTPMGTNYGVVTSAQVDTDWGIKWLDVNLTSTDSSGKVKKDSSGKRIDVSRTVGYVKVNVPKIDIWDEYSTMNNGFNMLCNLIFGVNIFPSYHNLFGFGNLDFAMPPSRVAPEYIGIPQESKRYVWGPWFSFNPNSGQAGKVQIDEDADMRPESFGSIATMNEFATNVVKADMATLLNSETGYVQIAEIPQYNLAERFYGSGPYVTNISISIDASDGYKTTYNFSTWTKTFGKLSQYNLKLFKETRSKSYGFQKKIRELFRNVPGRQINSALLKMIEPKMPRRLESSNVIAGAILNSIAASINGQDPGGVSMSAVSAQEMMRGLGTNYSESFATSYEQLYTPIFSYNQKDPAAVRRAFNEGNN